MSTPARVRHRRSAAVVAACSSSRSRALDAARPARRRAPSRPTRRSYRAFDVTEEKFGAGVNGPLLVVADAARPVGDERRVLAEQVRDRPSAVAAMDDVAAVAPIGASDDDRLAGLPGRARGGPEQRVDRGAGAATCATLSPPADGESTLGVAGQASEQHRHLREARRRAAALPRRRRRAVVPHHDPGVPLAPGAADRDAAASCSRCSRRSAAIIGDLPVGLAGATLFGMHQPGPILSFLPIILVGILFGLAMDYQLFLVSGMREAYVHGAPARVAVAQGFRAGRVGRDRRGDHHDLGVRGLHLLARRRPSADRLRPGVRRAARRVRGADAAHARRSCTCSASGLVAAEVARPDPARRRRRGRRSSSAATRSTTWRTSRVPAAID